MHFQKFKITDSIGLLEKSKYIKLGENQNSYHIDFWPRYKFKLDIENIMFTMVGYL